MALVENYAGVEPDVEVFPFKPDDKRLLDMRAARCLLSQAVAQPDGPEAAFLANASQEGWILELMRRGNPIPGITDVLQDMRAKLRSEVTLERVFGQLIASSLPAGLPQSTGEVASTPVRMV